MISKTCKEAGNTIPSRGAPKEEYLFVNAEEEFFYEVKSLQLHLMLSHSQRTCQNKLNLSSLQQAAIKFHYSVQDEKDSCLSGRWSFDDVPMKPFRTVMLIPADRMPVIMDKLKEYLAVWSSQ